MRVGLESDDPNLLEGLVDQAVTGFGTAIDEKILGIEDFKQLMINQKTQSEGIDVTWRKEAVDRFISEDENTAVFAEDIYFIIKTEEENLEMYLRFSVVLNYSKQQWKVIHWHGSKPEQVESEKDTWGLESYKQKAEELQKLVDEKTADLLGKNRELEIEAALEKVRSASMAMHKSEELVQVVRILDKAISGLGIEGSSTQILTDFPNSENGFNVWLAVEGQDYLEKFHVPFIKHPSFKKLITAVQKGTEFYTETYSKTEKNEFFKALFENSAYRAISKERQDFVYNTPGMERVNVLSRNSILIFQRYDLKEFSKEEEEIFKRFGNEFEQAYTRFLDLQKAEAQAREAQIEVALEKVRSASMAMHKSEELIQVVRILDKQILGLGIETEGTQIITDFSDKEKGINDWFAKEGQDFLEKFYIPYINHSLTERIDKEIQKGTDFYTDNYSKNEKNEYFKLLFKYSDFRTYPKESQDLIYNAPGWSRVLVLSKNSILIFQRFDLKEFSKEEEEIFKRFGKVFEQAYTRFLDLQKAEAQAREAQIEAALEKVRSASMAMHKSEELVQVVRILDKQILGLGIETEGTQIITDFLNSEKSCNDWISREGHEYPEKFHVPYINHPITEDFFNAVEKNIEFYTAIYPETEKNEYLKLLFKYSDFGTLPKEIQDLVYNTPGMARAVMLSKNSILIIARYNLKEFSKEEAEIFKRFGKVFEQAYTRFLDLEKAEAQAREAQIEAALEKVRSASMAMHKSDDLLLVIRAVHEQITELGIEVDASNFLTFIENSRDIYLWAITNTHTYQQKLRVTYIDFGLTKKM